MLLAGLDVVVDICFDIMLALGGVGANVVGFNVVGANVVTNVVGGPSYINDINREKSVVVINI